MDELNIASEKEAELSGKSKQLEDDVRKEKSLALELQGKMVLAQKQNALLEEAIKGFSFSFYFFLFMGREDTYMYLKH